MHRYGLTVALVGAMLLWRPSPTESQTPAARSSLDSLLSIPISAASRYEQTAQEAAASITVVTREDIHAFGYRTLADVLEAVQGFYTTFDRSYIYLGTRGFGRPSDNNDRVLLLVDGRRWNDVLGEAAAIDDDLGVPLEMVERVEVVRGPGSALYGSSAMLAVVNIVTRRPGGDNLPTVHVGAGDHGFQRGATTFSGAAGGVALSGSAMLSEDRGPDLYFPEFDVGASDGWARDIGFSRVASIGVTLTRGPFELGYDGSQSRRVYPTAPYGAAFATRGTFRNQRRSVLFLGHRARLSPRLELVSSAEYHTEVVDGHIEYEGTRPTRRYDFDGTRWVASTQAIYDLSEANRLVAGAEAQRIVPAAQWAETDDPTAVALGIPFHVLSAYAQDEWQVHRDLAVVAGGRVDRYSNTGSAVSPRGALVYHPVTGTTFKLLYGEAFRAPTPLERFLADEGTEHDIPPVGPERIRTTEVVWEQRVLAGLQLSVSGYDYRMRDLIVQTEDSTSAGFIYANLGRVSGRGVGAELTGRFAGRVTLFANTSIQTSRDEGTDERLSNSPGYLFRLGATFLLPLDLHLGARVLYDAARDNLWIGTTDAAARLDVNLRLPTVGPLEASVALDNALDAEFRHPAGLELRQLSIPQDGRRIRLALSARF